MSAFTLRLKNKVTGIHGSERPDLSAGSEADDSAVLSKRLPLPKFLASGDVTAVPAGTAEQQVMMLKNRVKMLEVALQEAREEAFQAGYDEGKEVAESDAKRRIEDLSEEFTAMVQSLKVQYDHTLEKMNEPLLKLAMKIAEKILRRELLHKHDYNEILSRQIKQLLNEIADQNRVIIHVNPNQLDWVKGTDILKELNLPSEANISFVKNDKLKPGECLMETEEHIIEGVLSRQLDNLENEILDKEARWRD